MDYTAAINYHHKNNLNLNIEIILLNEDLEIAQTFDLQTQQGLAGIRLINYHLHKSGL